jgi:hypothetical protein
MKCVKVVEISFLIGGGFFFFFLISKKISLKKRKAPLSTQEVYTGAT